MGRRSNVPTNGRNSTIMLDSERLPSFDKNALSILTDKIEKGLGRAIASTRESEVTERSHKPANASSGSIALGPSLKIKTTHTARGTKRDSQGNAKVVGQGKEREVSNNENAVLLREILALGGTEEDLALVVGVPSDEDNESEVDGEIPPDHDLRKDLAAFAAGLGVEGGVELEMTELDVQEELGNGTEGSSDSVDTPSAADISAEIEPAPNPSGVNMLNYSSSKDPNRLIFEARPDWHAFPLPSLPIPEFEESTLYGDAIKNLKDFAVSLLEADSNIYTSVHQSSSSSHRFLSMIMSSGTLSDKVSALTLVVQESPVHNTKSFENLLTLAKKRSRGQAIAALGALKDLLGVGVVLPASRRLKYFAAQPGLLGSLQTHSIFSWKYGQKLPGEITKVHLISWAYEDWLKETYFDILKVLEGWCSDEVVYARSRAITYVYELLKEKPEQESNLLRLLVNKLGDPDKKIASRTSYLLLQLQTSHPLMKPTIISSVESELLLRPGQSVHAKYYAINTLNQTILSAREEDLARKLLEIYFDLFVSLLKKPDPEKPVVGPIVNRKGQIQGGGGPMGKKAKDKATKGQEAKLASEETTEKMISAVLTGVNRAFPFSKADDVTLEKHMDTLFRITHSSNFNTSIQALLLIEQLATSKNIAVDRFYRTLYESLLDPRLIASSKHALYLNLLFRALRSDINVKRVKAFAKRLLQIITLHQPPFICGVLYLLRELESTFPGLRSLIDDAQEYDEIEEETFHDVPEDGRVLVVQPMETIVHPDNTGNALVLPESYDGRKRDPEHSNADKSCLWESIPFLVHFHPSVSLFASRLISDQKMPPKPDLASHTLTHFLDRFVYRNAKSAPGGARGSSIMQPLAGGDSRGVLLSSRAVRMEQEPVNSEIFWRRNAEDIAVDEVFFHKYFSQTGKAKQASREKKLPSKSAEVLGNEDGQSEDEIWQALVDSRPELEGASDGDSDLDMQDDDDSAAESSLDMAEIAGEGANDTTEKEDRGSKAFEDEISWSDAEGDSHSDADELFEKELHREQALSAGGKDTESNRQKRRKLKNLPTFASVDDYAEMLEDDEDEDL